MQAMAALMKLGADPWGEEQDHLPRGWRGARRVQGCVRLLNVSLWCMIEPPARPLRPPNHWPIIPLNTTRRSQLDVHDQKAPSTFRSDHAPPYPNSTNSQEAALALEWVKLRVAADQGAHCASAAIRGLFQGKQPPMAIEYRTQRAMLSKEDSENEANQGSVLQQVCEELPQELWVELMMLAWGPAHFQLGY